MGALGVILDHAGDLPRGRARARALVHGDLYARHVLVDGTDAACGVIDWSDVHVGEPATDLAVAHTMLPARAHGDFRAAYGAIGEAVWELARFRALYHTVSIVLYAHDVADRPLLADALGALGRLARAAPGR